jgi:micrococcal nuclease
VKHAALPALGLVLVVVAVSGCAGQPEQARAPAQTISADRAAVTAPARTAPTTRVPARSGAAGTADTIVRVTDGDTIVLTGLGRTRLIGIDTPEVYFRRECFGQEASSFMKRLLPAGTRVRYRFDVERRDRYGRALAYVWKGRMFVNAELAATPSR